MRAFTRVVRAGQLLTAAALALITGATVAGAPIPARDLAVMTVGLAVSLIAFPPGR
jgi:hypothetical protein